MAKVKMRVTITDENKGHRATYLVVGNSKKAYSTDREMDVVEQIKTALKPFQPKNVERMIIK